MVRSFHWRKSQGQHYFTEIYFVSQAEVPVEDAATQVDQDERQLSTQRLSVHPFRFVSFKFDEMRKDLNDEISSLTHGRMVYFSSMAN
jgi:hypothetical protein